MIVKIPSKLKDRRNQTNKISTVNSYAFSKIGLVCNFYKYNYIPTLQFYLFE